MNFKSVFGAGFMIAPSFVKFTDSADPVARGARTGLPLRAPELNPGPRRAARVLRESGDFVVALSCDGQLSRPEFAALTCLSLSASDWQNPDSLASDSFAPPCAVQLVFQPLDRVVVSCTWPDRYRQDFERVVAIAGKPLAQLARRAINLRRRSHREATTVTQRKTLGKL